MQEAITAGSISRFQTRSRGASKRYDPEISIPCRAALSGLGVECVQVYCQVGEIAEVPHREKIVHKRQGGLEALRQRRVVGRPDQRIEPDETPAAPLEP